MVELTTDFATSAVGVTAIVASAWLMADPIDMTEGINELYSPAASTAVRITETSDNHFEAQIIDVRMHRLATLELELREDGSVNVLASESDFYDNGEYVEKMTGDKRAIMPDKVAKDLRREGHTIDPEQTQALQDLMLSSPDVWPFAGGEVAVGDHARIAETEAGNEMGSCIIIPNEEGPAQSAICLKHEFNTNMSVSMTATMHIATENGLVSSHILTDTPNATPALLDQPVSENIQRGLDAGMSYGAPSAM